MLHTKVAPSDERRYNFFYHSLSYVCLKSLVS